MPGPSGGARVERMRALDAAVRVLAMSGFSEPQAPEAPGAHPDGFIRKPFMPDELRARLQALLDPS